jgi:hypothetical protein
LGSLDELPLSAEDGKQLVKSLRSVKILGGRWCHHEIAANKWAVIRRM